MTGDWLFKVGVIATWVMEEFFDTPCPCLTPVGRKTASPGLSCRGICSPSCSQPSPAVTRRSWPSGWVCQRLKCPGGEGDVACRVFHIRFSQVFAQLFNALASRSSRKSAFQGLFSNPWLWGAIDVSILLQLLVIYVPFLGEALGTVPLQPQAWLECIALASLVLVASELRKQVMWGVRKLRR